MRVPLVVCSLSATLLTATATSWGEETLRDRLDKFVPVRIEADTSHLSQREQDALDHLVEAARLMHPIFIRQAWHHNAEYERTLNGELAKMFAIHRGLWDRIDTEPFLGHTERPDGAGFYPEDLTRDEFNAYTAQFPAEADGLQGLFTVVRRFEGGRLMAIPYSRYFAEWLRPAAHHLRLAAKATENASLAKFLMSRAAAFESDDYYQSDMDWMDLDGRVEITIGPYETYEDRLFGYKAAFEAFVTISDPAASEALAQYKSELPAMEKNLPIPDSMKTVRGAESPIRVVDVVYTAGDTRSGVQTIAYNLPNDERVREAKGSKKVLLRNVIEAKFDGILIPIAQLLVVPEQVTFVDRKAFTQNVLFHELSHGLGPGKIKVNGRDTEVRLELRELYSPLEEAKADIMGIYNLIFMMEKGVLAPSQRKQVFVTWLASLFRSIRFGTEEAHGKANAIQLNYMMRHGGVVRTDHGTYAIDFDAFPGACRELVKEICLLQGTGDYAKTALFFDEFASLTPDAEEDLVKLATIPVDIRPIYAAD